MRKFLFIAGALVLLLAADTAYEAYKTLERLDVIEAERDQWQRPADILQALELKAGDVAVDFGSGSGYFALKLSSTVGPSGKVYAVDLRKLSLTFLWLRTIRRQQRNIDLTPAGPEEAHLPGSLADAVLVLNTYHELSNAPMALDQIALCLRPGGRLVVVDPVHTGHGELRPDSAADQLRQRGFQIVRRDDRFIEQPRGEPWWIIVARKP